MIFTSIGKLTYSPNSHLGTPEKWAILSCDDEIGRYYRSLYSMEHPYLNGGYSLKLNRPVWGSHISSIRGENIPNMHLWGLDANKTIEFSYEPPVQSNGEYYWLNVQCPRLEEIRRLYGLSPQPRYGYHLTIGRST